MAKAGLDAVVLGVEEDDFGDQGAGLGLIADAVGADDDAVALVE
jgi:hypothetical protein